MSDEFHSSQLRFPVVVAVVEEPRTVRATLNAAAEASHFDHDTTIIALHIDVDPKRMVAAPEEISLQNLREQEEGSANDRAAEAERMFEHWSAMYPEKSAIWRLRVGSVDAVLPPETHHADLIVLARAHNLDASDALHAALFHAKKLVLLVPDGFTPSPFLDHIAIAWKDHAQARRAVEHALPWLKRAKRISIIIADEPGQCDSNAVETILSEHGLQAGLATVLPAEGEHAAQAILREVHVIGAQSLVMGAFRFGMIADWFFGGVTHEILHRGDLPVFLMH